MSEPIHTYSVRVTGLWSLRHTVSDQDGKTIGVLVTRRNKLGLVVGGEYRPEKGEKIEFKREPGLLRAQFSCWSEGNEWLGSTIRPGTFRRTIELWTGGKPYRLVPALGIRKGWRVIATKTGCVAEVRHPLLGRSAELRLYRKMDLELLLFAYFVGTLARVETVPPTSLEAVDRGKSAATASKA